MKRYTVIKKTGIRSERITNLENDYSYIIMVLHTGA